MRDLHLLTFLLLLAGAMMSTALTYNTRRYCADMFGATAEAVAGVKLTAMGFMGEIRNAAMKKAGEEATHAATFKFLTAVTAIKQKGSSEEIFEKAAHGIETGSVVYCETVVGPTTGLLKAGLQEFFYFEKVGVSTSEFKLYMDEARTSPEKVPTAEAVTSMSLRVLEESSEVPVAIEWAVAGSIRANLQSKQAYNIAVPQTRIVSCVGYGKKATAGTATKPAEYRIFEKVQEEEVGSSKVYTITETNLSYVVQ